MDGIGKDLTQIAFAFISVATIALLVGHSSDTVNIIKAGGSTFNGLLSTVMLQSNYNNAFGM